MKKILLFFLIGFTTPVSWSQVATQRKSLEKKEPIIAAAEPLQTRQEIPLFELTERLPSADRYILDLKSLMNYFIDTKIPSDFPLYRNEKSFEYNRKKAIKWFKQHRDLISKDRLSWLNLS